MIEGRGLTLGLFVVLNYIYILFPSYFLIPIFIVLDVFVAVAVNDVHSHFLWKTVILFALPPPLCIDSQGLTLGV